MHPIALVEYKIKLKNGEGGGSGRARMCVCVCVCVSHWSMNRSVIAKRVFNQDTHEHYDNKIILTYRCMCMLYACAYTYTYVYVCTRASVYLSMRMCLCLCDFMYDSVCVCARLGVTGMVRARRRMD